MVVWPKCHYWVVVTGHVFELFAGENHLRTSIPSWQVMTDEHLVWGEMKSLASFWGRHFPLPLNTLWKGEMVDLDEPLLVKRKTQLLNMWSLSTINPSVKWASCRPATFSAFQVLHHPVLLLRLPSLIVNPVLSHAPPSQADLDEEICRKMAAGPTELSSAPTRNVIVIVSLALF